MSDLHDSLNITKGHNPLFLIHVKTHWQFQVGYSRSPFSYSVLIHHRDLPSSNKEASFSLSCIYNGHLVSYFSFT